MDGDIQTLSDNFSAVASSAERYMNELDARPDKSPTELTLRDEHLAKFHIYFHFVNNACLQSRDALLARLRELEQTPEFTNSQALDSQTFDRYCRVYVRQLIREHGGEQQDENAGPGT